MKALVLHAPSYQVSSGKKSFSSTMRSGIGTGYAIPQNQRSLIIADCKIILLDKGKKQRAEGTLVSLKPTVKARNGQQRYDIKIKNLKPVIYKSEMLTRNGIAII